MTWELALDIFLDALKDSALVFAFVFVIHVIISFFENKMASVLIKHQKIAPLFGSLFGLIPQCGTSVLGADLFLKRHITIGTLCAIFLSCSDESFIVLLAHPSDKTIMVLPLIAYKLVIGFVIGFALDLIIRKQEINKEDYVGEEHCHEHHHENTKLHQHLVHPLLHALELFAYVLAINLILGFIIGFVGEENFANFIISNKYLSPLFCSIIGLIPNCASSVLLCELFIDGNIAFGSLLAGLLVNAGLGLMVLLKSKGNLKNILIIVCTLFITGVLFGYLHSLIFGF